VSVQVMLDLIKRVVDEIFLYLPVTYTYMAKHVLFSKRRLHLGFVLRWRFGYFLFLFCIFSKKQRLLTLALYFDKGFLLWLRILMNVSHFNFVFWWSFLCLHILMKFSLTSYFNEGLFGFIFWRMLLWVRILMNTSHFDFVCQPRFCFSSEKWRLLTRLCILMKLSLPSYFDEAFFDFVFRRMPLWLRILTKSSLGSYFDEAFFGFIFWQSFLWLRILTKVSLALYFDEGSFGFLFWWMLHTLTSYCNEGFIFSLKNEGFTLDFVFWWSFLCLRILMKLSLTSYFNEGLFGFIFWRRLLSVHILTNASHFDFVFQWRFQFFSKNEGFTPDFVLWQAFFGFIFWRSFLWLCISTKISLASYFDEGFFGLIFWWTLHSLTSYFNQGFGFSLKNKGCTNDFVFWQSFLCLRIFTKLSLTS
jgi:hypothetical protein